ncbi:MAG: CheR family methyltransferase, partial [Candidatus Sulfotelmatobacter sp.]
GVLNVSTGFFRHPGAMNALARYVVPQIYQRRSEDSSSALRIWSAGCGTGEEPYSIAMALCDALAGDGGNGAGDTSKSARDPKTKKGSNRNGGVAETSLASVTVPWTREWSVHIVGSDLLPSAIEAAERGLYPQSALTGLPPAIIRACFSKIGNAGGNVVNNLAQPLAAVALGRASGNGSVAAAPNGNGNGAHLLVKPRLRSLVTFNTMNLTKPVYIGRFDCIFCMDVLPHLSRTQRTALLERLHLYLEPGGYLFLSQTEKLYAPNLNFRPECFDGYTVHRKPLAASAAYGR